MFNYELILISPFSLVETVSDDGQYRDTFHHHIIPLPPNLDPYFVHMRLDGPQFRDYFRGLLKTSLKSDLLFLLVSLLICGLH